MKPILSISIPAYGYPNSLKANVAKLLTCTRQDIEIVVVDNDETGTQIKERMLKIKDSRFHYYQNERNIGRANNIVRAIEKAEADFVLLMSCDDELNLDALDRVIDVIYESPDLALIMGTIVTSLGVVTHTGIGAGRYERGFQVLNALPFFGSLHPLIINKKYIECERMYDLDECHMQNRLAITVANSGDLMVLDCVLGMQVDYNVERFGAGKIEIYENGIDMSSWDTGDCYYGPHSRIRHLQAELDIINQYQLRSDKKIKIVDKFVSRRMGDLCEYLVGCHDTFLVSTAGTEGFMTYEEVFDIFLDHMGRYFTALEQNKCYFFTGRLHDIVNNERLLIEYAETIMDAIREEKSAVIWDCGEKNDKLIGFLELINIKVKGVITENTIEDKKHPAIGLGDLSQSDIVLVPDVFREEIDELLERRGKDSYYFMDQMSKYLEVAYCSKYPDEAGMRPFLNFF